MRRIILAAIILAFAFTSFNSCILDPKEDKGKPQEPVKYPPIDVNSPRDNVLKTLQLAYVNRVIEKYQEILDDGFVFHFSQADFNQGNVEVEQWDRAADIASTRNIFNRNFQDPEVKPISKISLTLRYPEGDDSWNQMTPEDQETYPDETWYEKTVRYDLIATSGPIDYTGLDIEASFIVRAAEVNGKQIWRIISWRDDTAQ